MVKKTGIGLVAFIALLIGISFLLPAKIHLERHTIINATPDAIYPYISDFRKFNSWSPWANIDPKTKYTFEGPDRGIGSKMTWESNNGQVGTGTQEIIEADPNKRIKNKLTFGSDESFATFTLTPRETQPKWSGP